MLVECYCGGKHYLEIWFDDDGVCEINLIDQSDSLLGMIRTWWEQRKSYLTGIVITKDDAKQIIEHLQEYIK